MKRHAPAAGRNREPIAAVLTEELPSAGLVLEVASGTGEHAVHFARTFAYLDWQPSDPDLAARESIDAWRAEEGLDNLRSPLAIDATALEWPIAHADAVVCINMVHISPWAATEGLFAHAAELLPIGAPVMLYGPYVEPDVPTAPSNKDFDCSLKARDPEWGLRNLADVDALADRHGFERTRRVAMPANNLTVVYRRRA